MNLNILRRIAKGRGSCIIIGISILFAFVSSLLALSTGSADDAPYRHGCIPPDCEREANTSCRSAAVESERITYNQSNEEDLHNT